ncbi:MAG: HD domain-containing protein [Acidimicrobiales bacterium]|nr:HD domain-containing protein [Acidimicrobiales bacterium]
MMEHWQARPVLARFIRVVVALAPVVLTLVVTASISRVFIPAAQGWDRLGWWLVLTVIAVALMTGLDRLFRRIAPLSTLLRISLVFPDEAPSRFAVALRAGNSKKVKQRIDAIRESGIALTEDQSYASQMLEMVALLGEHDRLTRGHCERVRAYTEMIIEEMSLPAKAADRLRWGALLHDLGKLMVPAEILNKVGRPTAEEWEVLKTHPAEGLKLAAPIADWLGEWISVIGEHHERWDGDGYPAGLAGENIHIGARIVAVADTYDVITSARSYKKPITAENARAEIARCAGTQFDPAVVRAFLSVGIGRLRFIAGPMAWLSGSVASIPGAGVAPIAASTLAGTVALVSTSIFVPPVEPLDIAFSGQDEPVIVVDETLPTSSSLVVVSSTRPGTVAITTTVLEDTTLTTELERTSLIDSTTSPTVSVTTQSAVSAVTTGAVRRSSTTQRSTTTSSGTTTTTLRSTTTTKPTTTTTTTTASTTTTTVAPPGPTAGLLISEFSANGANGSGDFVEIYNASSQPRALTGLRMKITSHDAVHSDIVLADVTLPSGGFYLIKQSGSSVAGADQTFDGALPKVVGFELLKATGVKIDAVGTRAAPEVSGGSINSPSLGREGEGVVMLDPAATSSDQSVARRHANPGSCVDTDNNAVDFVHNFAAGSVTPRGTASGPAPCGSASPFAGTSGTLIISELRTDGPGSGRNDFIEFYNPTGVPVSLAGWKMDGAGGTYDFPNVTLVPGQHFLVGGTDYSGPVDATTGNSPKNDGTVNLRNASGTVVDSLTFATGPNDLPVITRRLLQSYVRKYGCQFTGIDRNDFEHVFYSNPQTMNSAIEPCPS